MLSQALNACSVPVTFTLRLGWSFFLLFGSPSAWLVQLHNALSFSPLFPRHTFDLFSLSFFSFFTSCRYVFCLKTGAPRQAVHHVWMCSDTSSSQGLISLGKMGVWHVYILFPFLCRIKTLHLLSLSHHTANETFAEGKQMLTRLLHLKRRKRLVNRQTRIALGGRNPNPPTGVYRAYHVCLGVCMSVCLLDFCL